MQFLNNSMHSGTYNEMKNFCLYHKKISTESVMYVYQQPQMMYEIHQIQNDNDYT